MSSTLAMPATRRGPRRTPPATLDERPNGKPRKPTKPHKPKKPTYAPGHHPQTKVLSAQARHLASRFSFGVTPALAAEVQRAGGHLAWFDRQLATAYDGTATGFDHWWPDLDLAAPAVWKRQSEMVRHTLEVSFDIASRVLVRRAQSPKQVLEVMTKFWENHLHVPINADNVAVFRAGYGEVIRAGALGRYDDLLAAAVLHPAMLMYLGNASSTKTHPNENLGRELLELHTVGVGHHTEDDVKASARILTGWRVKLYSTWEPYYSPDDHWTGPVQVLGFSDTNAAADGRDMTLRYLRALAHHPATARRIATKLVRVFVSDDVPAGLVDRLARIYLANDTAIRPVLRALVRSPEFRASVDAKTRDADDDVVAAHRVLGVQLKRPKGEFSAANQLYWQAGWLGLPTLTWPRPDGQPLDDRSWSSPTRVLASVGFHWELVNRSYGTQVSFAKPASFLPEREMALRDLVDHVSRTVLHRPSTSELLRAVCLATGLRPGDTVTSRSPVLKSQWPVFITPFLDSPTYFRR